MENFFHSLHERRESLKRNELSKRNQWREDEGRVRSASSDFVVKYLGCAEVLESKGIRVIENAINTLKFRDLGPSSQFSFFKSKSKPLESIYHIGTLHVNGDGLRFVEDSTEDVLVESPIEKISFCGPVEKGKFFAYICREESHWKWICHAFKTVEEHADRINNAVGCAFRICLEKRHKARMEKESKSPTYSFQSNASRSQSETVNMVVEPIGAFASPASSATLGRSSCSDSTSSEATRQPPISNVSQAAEPQEPQQVDHFELAWELKAPRTGNT